MYILKACSSTQDADMDTEIHDDIVTQMHTVAGKRENQVRGAERERERPQSSRLFSAYAKRGSQAPDTITYMCSLKAFQQVFDELTMRDVVLWNALIARYAQQGPSAGLFSANAKRGKLSQMQSPMLVSSRHVWAKEFTMILLARGCRKKTRYFALSWHVYQMWCT
ncbi:hypothetical protein GOP47_0017200 [Adiantum capillus-veneris]|uniref:Uncharacterized protein n=1 Tax=Adiantum capillus-veneris TaxID=13818 RepID=A0A9D4UJ78_ADICA|nr:hypothetical protein GOP47_0017200 [Adiantum capillus-veneris]